MQHKMLFVDTENQKYITMHVMDNLAEVASLCLSCSAQEMCCEISAAFLALKV